MKNQQGIALITVLIITAIIVPIISYLVYKQELGVARTIILDNSNTTILYANSIEIWGQHLLQKNIDNDAKKAAKNYDGLDEDWAKNLSELLPESLTTIEDDSESKSSLEINGKIIDLQSKLNINNLSLDNPEFNKLWSDFLENLKINNAEDITKAIIDWLDNDVEGEYEDDYYANLETSYRVANTEISNITELKLIAGIDEEVWKSIQPYVSALPINKEGDDKQPTKININTISKNALKTIFSINDIMADKLIENRPFKSLSEIKLNPLKERESLLSVETNHYMLNSTVKYNDIFINMKSHMIQEDGKIKLLTRHFSGSKLSDNKEKKETAQKILSGNS